MENALPTPNPNRSNQNEILSAQTRHYFLNQGQKISKVHALVDQGIMQGTISMAFFWLIEISLYILCVLSVVFILVIPSDIFKDIQLNAANSFDVQHKDSSFFTLLIIVKLFLFILALMPLFLARALQKSRMKTALIQEAFSQIDDMKKDFDKAMLELKL